MAKRPDDELLARAEVRRRVARAKESLYHHEALPRHEIARVAVSAICDPRCVVKYLRALPLQSTMTARIEQALKLCGYAKLVRPPATVAEVLPLATAQATPRELELEERPPLASAHAHQNGTSSSGSAPGLKKFAEGSKRSINSPSTSGASPSDVGHTATTKSRTSPR